MKQIRIFPQGSYIHGIDFSSDIQCNLFVDMLQPNLDKTEINILLLSEPDIITGISKGLPTRYDMYDFILTHNQEVLDKYTNAVFFVFNSIWASNKDYSPKEFSISTIVGNKTWTKNQTMRQQLWYSQDRILNRKFYVSAVAPPEDTLGNPSVGENKDILFQSQFHIAIENCSINGYFTEKILDCFISKTVPIYLGCSNIDNFFNDKGILKFSSIPECIELCNKLTPDTYTSLLPYIEENYTKALEYIDWQKRLLETIKTLNITEKNNEQL